MDFSLNEEQTTIRDTARDFAQNEVAPTAIERDIKAEFPFDIVKKLGEFGFMGMMVPPEWGGAGLDTLSYVLALEEIGKVDASVCVIMSVNNSLVCFGIEKWGTDEQKEKFLKPLALGLKLGCFCLSEPEATAAERAGAASCPHRTRRSSAWWASPARPTSMALT